jgi:hypothetical protein
MKKVIQVWYLEEHERRLFSDFHTGFIYQLEDGTMVHKMSTDMVADKIVPPLGSPVGSIIQSELDQSNT